MGFLLTQNGHTGERAVAARYRFKYWLWLPAGEFTRMRYMCLDGHRRRTYLLYVTHYSQNASRPFIPGLDKQPSVGMRLLKITVASFHAGSQITQFMGHNIQLPVRYGRLQVAHMIQVLIQRLFPVRVGGIRHVV